MSLAASVLIRPSRRLALLAVVMTLIANVGVMAWALQSWRVDAGALRAGVAVVVSCTLSALALRRWFARRRSTKLVISVDGRQIQVGDDAESSWSLAHGSLIWPGILSLRLTRIGSAPLEIALLADSTDAEAFRKLSVWLHWLQRKGLDELSGLSLLEQQCPH